MWDLDRTFTRFCEHGMSLSLEDFEHCENEDDVVCTFHDAMKERVMESLL